ncbi:protein aubergine-like [Fopius arisanus]|uniref:Protein aubergine-like n=1 Tax=Fopius arisanus TaxID=64838 RepID=A0A9R1T840_9HYME|nr:PREDICTED: protein aubergine-like [Fopius arisanus]
MEEALMGRNRGQARGIAGLLAKIALPKSSTADVPPQTPPQNVERSVRDTAKLPGPFQAQPPLEEPLIPGGESTSGLGRGALRGRRILIPEILNTRPQHVASNKRGSSGQGILLEANYFKVIEKPDWCLQQYRVDFHPEETNTHIKKGLVRQCSKQLGSYIFDGTVLYTTHNLTAQENLELTAIRQQDAAKICITIRSVGELVKGDPHYLQFYNILTRKCLELLNLQLVGRNYFDANSKIEIKEYKLELWPGYITSIRQHESDILMCVEINHKVMRQETLLHILERVKTENPYDYQNVFKSEVIGVTVLTGYNNNTYRIDDVDFNESPMGTFQSKGETIRYMDYYKNKYGIVITVKNQPLFVSRSSARDRRAGKNDIIYLVPELCRATGLTDEMRSDFRLMSALAMHTRVNPHRRIDKLLAFNRRMLGETTIQEEFNNWNLKLDTKLVEVHARKLLPEKLHFGNDRQVEVGGNGDWTKSSKDKGLYMTMTLKDWVVVVPERLIQEAKSFISIIRSATNFQISEPQYFEIRRERCESYTECLERIMSKANPQMIMCILAKNRADTYSAIKKKLCIDRPVPSQVITARCLRAKEIMSIAMKIAIQMNCKIGGIPWTIHIPLSGLMVVGYDVCHDINKKGIDFGALVASLDKKLSRYFSTVSAHTSGEELCDHLSASMAKALQKYREANNGALPSSILVYRDGVSEGQIPFVVEHEVMKVKQAISKFYGQVMPVKLGYIVVTKKINTRLFYKGRNPEPGTVVDNVITNPQQYDFFMVSQGVKQGTVSPTSYSVIYDSLSLNPDKIQILTYKMTHVYYNCSTTMRVPAPVQLAHKLSFLVSQSIHTPPTNNTLESLLYFL